MSNQPENEKQQPETVIPEAQQQLITQLSNAELEQVAGGMINPFSVTREEYINWSQQRARWVAENPQQRSHLLGSANPMATHNDHKP